MSDTLEIVEITDSSINPVALELDDLAETLEKTAAMKRQLSLSDTELDGRSMKKICMDREDSAKSPELMLTENESVIDDTVMNEPDIVEQNISQIDISHEKSEDDFLEELPSKSSEIDELELPTEKGGEEKEIGEESLENHESEHSSEEDDDDLMANAMKASVDNSRPQFLGQFQKPMNDNEPIALDDSDDDDDQDPHKSIKYESDVEPSSEYSVDNNVIKDSEDSDEEINSSYFRKPIRYQYLLTRKILKRSIQTARSAAKKRLELFRKSNYESIISAPTLKESHKETSARPVGDNPKVSALSLECLETEKNCSESELMEVSEIPSINKSTLNGPRESLNNAKQDETTIENKSQNENQKTLHHRQEPEKEQARIAAESTEKVIDKSLEDNSNESSHESSLLTEIANSTKDEIFNRYVLKNSDQSPTLEEFSEELFYCLQMNNQEIEKAKQLWNEKLHVKYKIRELMDTIRRHRAVMEIETFGYKPEAAGNNSHPIISSKSSTSSSEKHFMSTESVSRLIQDVRATMLKRDDKHRIEESSTGSNLGDNSLASQWNSLQTNSIQGRQGQIIDVQSIINDFRQKNPQEIPRRGRRMKNSFGGVFYDNQQSQTDDSRSFMSSTINNAHDFTNSTGKSSNSGYPEVSLHPVHSMYKNQANASAASSSSAGTFGGQRSSLLQSILTKQSTRNSTGFNHSLPSTSTLARLLTAPERSFQGSARQAAPPSRQSSTKVHNNGEITITPIKHANRNKDYSMEEDENSMEPPLIIDEAEDYEAGDRSSSKVTLSDLLCQGCKKNKAFFMCAGCSRQWYCSKECQEIAWDLHAESCMN